MANEFKVKHGLIVNGSGSTVLDVQGSQGQLFSITDSLSGSLFSVGDISGIPILEVFSDDTVKIGSYNNEAIVVSGSHATVSGSFSGSFVGDGSGLTGVSVTTPTLQQVTDQGATTTNDITITGSLNITGSITQAADTDINNIFGRVRLGSYVTDYAYFSHYDHGSNSSYALRQAPNGSTQINSATGQGISFNVNNNGKAFIDSSGKFGIGTTSPETTLHVKSPSSFTSTGSLQIDTTAVSSTQVFTDLKGGSSGDHYIFRHYRSSTLQNWIRDDQGRLQFYTKPLSAYLDSTAIAFYADTTVTGNIASFGTLSSTYMIVSSSGNVGIGTTSPSFQLHNTGTSRLEGRITLGGDLNNYIQADATAVQFKTANDYSFQKGADEYLVIKSTGKVGIGTTTPTEILTVEGNISASGHLYLNNTIYTPTNTSLKLYPQGTGHLYLGDAGNGFNMYHYSQNNDGLYTTYTYNSQYYQITTTGTSGFWLRNDTRVEGDLTVTGTVTAQEFHTEFVSASIIYESGSTKFGDTSDDIHSFSGSFRISGSGDHYFTDGNVGIGLTSPTGRLHLQQETNAVHDFKISSTGGTYTHTIGVDNSGYNLEISGSSNQIIKFNNYKTQFLDERWLLGDEVGGNYIMPASSAYSGSRVYAGHEGAFGFRTKGSTGNIDIIKLFDRPDNSNTGVQVLYHSASATYEGLVIDNEGNVGIGTSTPTEKLTVEGNISGSGDISVLGNITGSNAYFSSNVSIGTTTDTYPLNVQGDATISSGELRMTNGKNIRFSGGQAFSADTTAGTVTISSHGSFTSTTVNSNVTASGEISGSDVKIDDWGSVSASLATISASAASGGTTPTLQEVTDQGATTTNNIGIGTTSPAAALDVNGDAFIQNNGSLLASGSGYLRTGNDNGGTVLIGGDGSISYIQAQNNRLVLQTARAEDDIEFKVGESAATSSMFIDGANGRIGIGTTTPSADLDIEDATGVTIDVNSSSGDGLLRFQDAGVTKWFIGRDNTNQNFAFSSGSGLGNGNLLTLTTSGEVGVNTSSPAGVFEVQTVDSNRYIRFKAPNGEERFELYTGGTGNPADLYMYDADGTTKSISLRGGTSNSHIIGGNFGIGTSAPSEKLHVAGNIAISGSNATLQIREGSAELYKFTAGGSSLDMTVDATNAISIFQTGDVGIGTTTPVDKLHVDGNVTASAFYGDGTNLTNVQRVPKVEYLSLTSGISSNDVETLPNSLSYTLSSDGYEYLEVFLDGIRLNRTYEYSEVNTTQVRYLLNIPSGSMITYKSLTLV